jgi:acyl-CoA dehydrogenase
MLTASANHAYVVHMSLDTAALEDVLASVRSFVREVVVAREDEIENDGEVPAPIRAACQELGLFGFAIPQQYGGLGLSPEQECRLVIELGYTASALRSIFGANNGIAGQVLIQGGTEAQKQHWLPRLASGDVTATFALTEPAGGSDPASLSTCAVRDGNDWVITGAKRYIANAPIADALFVFARTDSGTRAVPGIGNFIVPAGAPGLSVAPREHSSGQGGTWCSDLYLDEVRVPAANLVGGPRGARWGYATAMRCLAHGRIHLAALCVGMAERLVEETVRSAQERFHGGRPVGDHQLVQGMVADSVTDLQAGQALVLAAARAFDEDTDREVRSSVAKYFCSEMVGRVADRAVQVLGGAGYTRGVPLERMYRDARLFRLYGGTSQRQQIIIARGVLGAEASPRQGRGPLEPALGPARGRSAGAACRPRSSRAPGLSLCRRTS